MWVSDSYEDIYLRAQANLAQGNLVAAYDECVRLSERLSQLKPALLDRRPELRNLLVLSLARQAEIRHIQGNFEPARQIYEQLLEMDPRNRDRWQSDLAAVRIDMGQVEAGLDELRALAVAHPSGSSIWLSLALECEGLGRLDEAEENFQRAARTARDPNDQADVYLALFDFYRAQGRVDEALVAWGQAWAAHGHGPGYVFPLYQMLQETGDLERARQYLRQEKNPLRKGFYQGMLAASEGDLDAAAVQWQRVAKMNPLEFEEGQEAWAESALRVDQSPQEVLNVLGATTEAGNSTLRGLILQAVAEARLGHIEHAQHVLDAARLIGLRSRPRQERLSAAHWALFDELVPSDAAKQELRSYFEADE